MIEKIKSKIKDGVLDLGCANGWSFNDIEMRDFVNKNRIPDTFRETNLGNCHNEMSYKVIFEGEEPLIVKMTQGVVQGNQLSGPLFSAAQAVHVTKPVLEAFPKAIAIGCVKSVSNKFTELAPRCVAAILKLGFRTCIHSATVL